MDSATGKSARRVFWALVIALLTLDAALAVLLIKEKGRRQDLLVALRTERNKTARFEAELSGFRQVVLNHDLSGFFVAGHSPQTGLPIRMDVPVPGIYYTIDVNCGACAANIPFLNQLVASGAPIVGLSDQSDSLLSAFAKTHNISFPIVAGATGELWSLVPRTISPVTMIVQGNKVSSILTGLFHEPEHQELKSVVSSLADNPVASR